MTLSTQDLECIWHPYTQMLGCEPPIAIVRGSGALLFSEDGKTFIDAVSSWWTNLHGHAHPYIAEQVAEQLNTLEHVIFAGFTHEAAVLLAERLLPLLPPGQSRLFFSDNGSTAVEVALKMAIQYWWNKGEQRRSVIALEGAYHGDTFGSMSASGSGLFTDPFRHFLFRVDRIELPVAGKEERALSQLQALVAEKKVAAFIFEPLVLGAGGMLLYDPEALDKLICCAHDLGVLCISDEVFTGFGRTGRLFAADYLQESPDMICLSKGLTGGTMPLAITSCTAEIYDAFLSSDRKKTFFHGHSYTANPVACRAALASLDLLTSDKCQQQIAWLSKTQQEKAEELGKLSNVRNAASLGTLLRFEIASPKGNSYLNSIGETFYRFSLERGVLLRPLGNVVYVLPPYCITGKQLGQVYDVIDDFLEGQTMERPHRGLRS